MSGTERETIFLRKRGVQQRMRCSGQIARKIEDTFVTVGQLVEAVESDQRLTEKDGIGPKTAETIEDWWDNRFEREEKIGSGSIERTGKKSLAVHFHNSWSDVIEERNVQTATERSRGDA